MAMCRFCSDPVFELSAGCVCYPDDRYQALCMQHVIKATPLGGRMTLIEDLTVDGGFAMWLAHRMMEADRI
jgi:hypothetical protein